MKKSNFSWLIPIAISSMHSACIAQQISEGGVKTSTTSRDQYTFTNSGISSTQSGASATVRGGTINTGFARSTVESELNPIVNPRDNSYFVGSLVPNTNKLPLINKLNSIQNSDLNTINKDNIIITSKGNLEDNLRVILSNNLKLLKLTSLPGDSGRSMPMKVDLTPEFEIFSSAINDINQLTKKGNSGAHVINNSHQSIINARVEKGMNISGSSLYQWNNGKQVITRLVDKADDADASNDQLINIKKNDSSTKVKTSVLGFSKNPNPNDGKKVNISVYSSNTRTPGRLVIQKDNEGKTPSLKEIATKYGTTEEELRIINNLPSNITDLTNYQLIVPTDTLNNGLINILDGDTWLSIANRYGITKEWLLSLNGLSEKSTPKVGENIQIPGLVTKDGTIKIIEGDTYAQLANRYGLLEIEILKANGLNANSMPSIGTSLIIPKLKLGVNNVRLPSPKPLLPALEFADYGAYTQLDVTYNVQSSKKPLFLQQIQTNIFSK